MGTGLSLRADPEPGLQFNSGTDPGAAFDIQFSRPSDGVEQLSTHLLVVYNANDPDSRELARYYAPRRGIADDHVFALSCSTNEEITRKEFEDKIRRPILSYIEDSGWMTRQPRVAKINNREIDLLVANRNDIWAIVLMRGVPLKVAPDPSTEGGIQIIPELQSNAAAVDSELALLPVFGLPKGGFFPNQFFDLKNNGVARVGPEMAKSMILVTRLDGPTPADVRRMIDDSLAAEQTRLAGLAVIDTRGLTDIKNAYTAGDMWLRSSRDFLVQDGWAVKFDALPDVLPASDPCNEVAFYLGWYTQNAMGPWMTPPRRFVPGAIAYHLHSFSASSVRSTTEGWVGPLISRGADATMGTVYEPSLGLTPRLDVFTKRMLEGNYFAEAAYASEAGLSWMVTVVGDPLYRPFRKPLDEALAAASTTPSAHGDWLFLQLAQRDLLAGRLEANIGKLEKKFSDFGATAVGNEGLGDILAKFNDPDATPATLRIYQKAFQAATLPIDRIRVGQKMAQYEEKVGQSDRAREQLRLLQQLFPEESKLFGVDTALNGPTTAEVPGEGAKPPKPPSPPQPPKPGRV